VKTNLGENLNQRTTVPSPGRYDRPHYRTETIEQVRWCLCASALVVREGFRGEPPQLFSDKRFHVFAWSPSMVLS
jgi:hypothetical protein